MQSQPGGGAGPDHQDGDEIVRGQVEHRADGQKNPEQRPRGERHPGGWNHAGINRGESGEHAEEKIDRIQDDPHRPDQARQADRQRRRHHQRGIGLQVGGTPDELLHLAPKKVEHGDADDEPDGALGEKPVVEGHVTDQPPDLAVPDLIRREREPGHHRPQPHLGDEQRRGHERPHLQPHHQRIRVDRPSLDPEERPVILRLVVIKHRRSQITRGGKGCPDPCGCAPISASWSFFTVQVSWHGLG